MADLEVAIRGLHLWVAAPMLVPDRPVAADQTGEVAAQVRPRVGRLPTLGVLAMRKVVLIVVVQKALQLHLHLRGLVLVETAKRTRRNLKLHRNRRSAHWGKVSQAS